MENIVITGMGLFCALGQEPEEVFKALCQGKNGVAPSGYSAAPMACHLKQIELPFGYDRSVSLAVVCAQKTLASSKPSFNSNDCTGIFVSSTKGTMHSVSSFLPAMMEQGTSRIIAKELKLTGPCYNVVAACATGIFAIASAIRAIKAGECLNALAGVSESALTELVLSGFDQMGVLSHTTMKPFRYDRDGFVPGEGAALFLLEQESQAKKRGANILARIIGTAAITESEQVVRFDETGASIAAAIQKALNQAGLDAAHIDAICVHGTATRNNDLCEANGIKRALGESASAIPCFGIKPAIGHVLGASAAVELAVSILCLQHNMLPPTLGNGEWDTACRLNLSQQPISLQLKRILSLNFGFGGHIGAIIIEKA